MGFCASAATGQTVAPPSRNVNSRLFIAVLDAYSQSLARFQNATELLRGATARMMDAIKPRLASPTSALVHIKLKSNASCLGAKKRTHAAQQMIALALPKRGRAALEEHLEPAISGPARQLPVRQAEGQDHRHETTLWKRGSSRLAKTDAFKVAVASAQSIIQSRK